MSNNAFSTTGLRTLTVNSIETFEVAPLLNLLPWNMTGGTATLKFTDPNGNNSSVAGTIGPTGYTATATWTVPNTPGLWTRAWDITDAAGIRQVMLPTAFEVVSSPS